MFDAVRNTLTSMPGDYWEQMKAVIGIACAACCGIGIFAVFYITHREISVGRSFAFTLIMLAPVAAMVAVIISYNIIIAVGMLGALSIIRFRHSMKESKNLVFVFWSVTAGLACGLSFYAITAAGCIVIAGIVLLIHIFVERRRYGTLSIKTHGDAGIIEEELNKHGLAYQLKYSSSFDATDSIEFLYELRYGKRKSSIINASVCTNIMKVKGVSSVKFVEL